MLNIFLFFQKKFFYLFIFSKRPEKKSFHGKKHPARPRSPDVNHIGLSTILLFSGAEK